MRAKHKIWLFIPMAIAMMVILQWVLPEPREDKSLEHYFWTLKTHDSRKFEVVVGGDSRVFRGVSPEAMAGRTDGRQVINLGYSSAGFDPTYMLFLQSRLVQRNGVIVLGITPHSLTRGAAQNEFYRQYADMGPYEVFRDMHLAPMWGSFKPYRMDHIIRDWFGSGQDVVYHEEFRHNGWVKSYATPDQPGAAMASYKKIFRDNPVSVPMMADLMDWVERMVKHGHKVVAFRPPSTDEMVQLEEELSGFDEITFRKALGQSGGHWVEFSNSDFRSYDGSHLHYESAEELSRRLADVIASIKHETPSQ